MAVTAVNGSFALADEPRLRRGDFDVDTITEVWTGYYGNEPDFRATRAQWSAHPDFPAMFLREYDKGGEEGVAEVRLEYVGLIDGQAIDPFAISKMIWTSLAGITVAGVNKLRVTNSRRLQTRQVDGDGSNVLDVQYWSPTTTYSWVHLGAPPTNPPFTSTQLPYLGAKGFEVVKVRGRTSANTPRTDIDEDVQDRPTEYDKEEIVPGQVYRCHVTVVRDYAS